MKAGTNQSHRNGPRWVRTSLALAVALYGIDALDACAAPSTASPIATVAHPTVLRQGDAVIGALPMKQPIHIEVALKLRNKDVLDAFIANNAKNQAKNIAPRIMTSDQFLANHAPTRAQAQAVADYLTSRGFKNVVIAPNRLLVSADGTALTAGNAFMTSFAQVRTHGGRIGYANTGDAHVPTMLSDKVLAVIGLQNVYQPQPSVQRGDAVHPMAYPRVGHFPLEFASIYGGTGVATAAGVTIGLITQGNLTQTIADLNTFTANNGLATVTTQTVNTGGTGSDTSMTATWDLETQDIVGMAGGQVGKLVFYNVPTLTDASLTADLNAAVSANAAKIISVAFFECEITAQSDGSAAADDTIFETAIAQGQTFSIAAGDASPYGADQCGDGGRTPSWPASSQYVVAVAGSSLVASTTSYQTETVWGHTGGSPSTFEPMPSWQQADVALNYPTVTTRAVPDVAFDADPNSGAKVVVDGAPAQLGGTALSASLFAGLWARAIAVRGPYLGFAGPMLYNELLPRDLHDITSGCNSSGLEMAPQCGEPGYDLASGLGSIKLSSAINRLQSPPNQPPVASFTYTTNGLTVNCTDTSTDNDGTIVSHSWKFGDGGTSTVTNPSHLYATAGTYVVRDTVTDNLGAVTTKNRQVTVSGVQLLGNTGFETGAQAPWSISANVLQNNSGLAHSGNWYTDIGMGSGAVGETDHVSQTATIPGGQTSATLTFNLHITTACSSCGALNFLYVNVYDASGTLLATLAKYSNRDATPDYVLHSLDMTPYIGQTVRIKFLGHNTGDWRTDWLLDDVALTVQ